jgi:hypothetical protein
MGFWSGLEETAVNGIAGSAGLAEVVPVVGLAANAIASGVHGADSLVHDGMSVYDHYTGDEEGAKRNQKIGQEQGVDAVAAAIPYVGVAAAATDLVAAGGDAVATGARAAGASDEQAPMMPTIGSTVVGAAHGGAHGALHSDEPGQMGIGDLFGGLFGGGKGR